MASQRGHAGSDASAPAVLDPRSVDARQRRLLGDWLALQHALALRPQAAVEQVRRAGAPRAVSARRTATFDRAAAIADLERAGAVALPVLSPAYPRGLAALSDPALLLHVRGDVTALGRTVVAIVGARAATVYGRRVARELAAELAAEGLVIASGLARGIDAEAHRGALEAGGTTVAVLACGIDRVYPREHRALAEEIAASGAVITELPLGTRPRRPFFPLRNRLISGLAAGVVIVEARERSGSLITADHALNQGREVFAVPGPINAATSAGANALLRSPSAHVALGAGDVLSELGIERRSVAEPRAEIRRSPEAVAILAALAHDPASRDELARRLSRPPEHLALDLVELQLEGCVSEDRDGRFRVVGEGDPKSRPRA